VAAHIDRQRVGVGAFAPGEHVAHFVQPHGTARRLAPLLKQRAALGIVIGQGLTVVAARYTGADLGHLHQAVPKTRAVDLEVFAGGGHCGSPCHADRMRARPFSFLF
jgi:hypothetical protein